MVRIPCDGGMQFRHDLLLSMDKLNFLSYEIECAVIIEVFLSHGELDSITANARGLALRQRIGNIPVVTIAG